MDLTQVLDAFETEAEALGRGLARLPETAWDRPTRCAPWSARELLGHVCVVLGWVPDMIEGQAPGAPEVSATEYYRPDHRFSSATNAARIELGQDRAARHGSGAELVADFTHTWQEVEELCRKESERRVVRTRHGDAMLLADFMLTRVVEVAVHGIDLADALGSEPWLTPSAADLVLELLVGPDASVVTQLGWSRARFLRKVTGREPLGAEESLQIARLGVTWLALG
ncbi:maleylpyruvate isomerase family mycothiol-dependent enzyme [Streptomyces sp. NBC_01800]|uniref:maleylpyruvate isomerase family mycothiol-dependent enzyme n=1 Tax=Streptomyces sp. NBC_01800 TaxID=2975945 RepID=UPI002DD9413E|nr:maleylpyruvate isomerase family mycothiol-dependent enzyme [Streptomyces sp. NBC_01800]WSA68783.1 maleylpyruvate isomerase family mycothiol-dependent enzyme [Streptomyces sp. NBC_01800]